MKLILAVLLVSISAAAQGQSLRIAPACGPNGVSFVDQDADPQPLVRAPDKAQTEKTKAQVFFIQDDGPGGTHQHFTVKIGLDGTWVGAYKQNAYFSVTVNPGEHHVCANVQSRRSSGRIVSLAHFVAEPGVTYFFRTQFLSGLATMYPIYPYLQLDQPDSDEGRYLIATYPPSDFHRRR